MGRGARGQGNLPERNAGGISVILVPSPLPHALARTHKCLPRQILDAVPGSTKQAWHSDNQSRGLTIIIPLVDFTSENGPTRVLVGSHDDKTRPRVMRKGGARVVQAPLGAIAAYDSRTYHRGLGNETKEGRPAIIFCYDREWSRPPGCGPYTRSMADARKMSGCVGPSLRAGSRTGSKVLKFQQELLLDSSRLR